MPEPKKPQDHKLKADAAEPESPAVLEVEVSGKNWTIDPTASNNFEVLDDIARWDDGDVSRMPIIMRRMLGDEQMRAAMESLRDERGVVSAVSGEKFLLDLLAGLNPN